MLQGLRKFAEVAAKKKAEAAARKAGAWLNRGPFRSTLSSIRGLVGPLLAVVSRPATYVFSWPVL